MSFGFHQAYCKPCQKSRAWRIRRISCRRAVIPSSRYCRTSSRKACTSLGFNSSSRSLFGPSSDASVAPPSWWRGESSSRCTSASWPCAPVADEDAGAIALAAFPSAGAIAPGVPVQVSALGYRSIRPRLFPAVKIYRRVSHRTGLAPRLNLVPRALPQPRQSLRLHRLGILHRRKSRRTQQRIRQRAILRTQPRHFGLEEADVSPLQQSLKKICHVLSSHTEASGGAAAAWAETVFLLRIRGAAYEWRARSDPWR